MSPVQLYVLLTVKRSRLSKTVPIERSEARGARRAGLEAPGKEKGGAQSAPLAGGEAKPRRGEPPGNGETPRTERSSFFASSE